jgi:arylsulfatase A-like enzyme
MTLVAVIVLSTGCGQSPEQHRPRHVLLVSIDALRADHLGSWGSDHDTSPFLDELAARGIRFPLAFVNTHGTPPSHTTMLTSLYQETHRVGIPEETGDPPDLRLPEGVAALQDILDDAGWTTVAVTGGGYMGGEFGFSRGFDIFDDTPRTVEQGTERLIVALRQPLEDRRPVFALFHTYEVHSPYRSPEAYQGLFGPDTCAVEPDAEALVPIQADAKDRLTPQDFDCLAALYDRGIRHTDDVLRVLFRDLDEIGFLDDALVVITADHGEEFGDHGGLLHRGSLFEELIHVPLIVWGAGVPGGKVDPSLASTIDIAPTILAWAGIDPPRSMEGRDLLRPPPGDRPERVFSQYGTQLYSVRTPRWKLIAGGRWAHPMLFDLERDPDERHNVAAAEPDTVDRLIEELTRWRTDRPRVDVEPAPGAELQPATREQLEALGYLE